MGGMTPLPPGPGRHGPPYEPPHEPHPPCARPCSPPPVDPERDPYAYAAPPLALATLLIYVGLPAAS
jgi:hypothetical protein